MNNKAYEEYLKLKTEKSCFNCKYYDRYNCCMYDCACRCILDETETGEKCEHFMFGKYNQDELEKTNYK